MKKQVLMLLGALMVGTMAINAAEKLVPFESMPQAAQDFTRKYFPSSNPMYKQAYVTYDAELFDSSYMVVFTTGDGLEFNRDGEWKDFECKDCVVPAEIIPAPIKAYLDANFPDQQVKKIEKNRRDYEVKLSSGFELKFDLQGRLVEVDD